MAVAGYRRQLSAADFFPDHRSSHNGAKYPSRFREILNIYYSAGFCYFGGIMKPSSQAPSGLRVAGTILRTAFICLLVLVTLRVSTPQSTTVWTVLNSPGDSLRLALGIGVSIWLLAQLFRVPHDEDAHRTWVYLGLAAIPVALVCLLATL